MSFTLRGYQTEVIGKVRAAIETGHGRICLAMMTGGGKTVVAAHLINSAVSKGSRVLFAAHRRELISQSAAKLIAIGVPESSVGVLMGDGRIRLTPGGPIVKMSRPYAQVQVGSIDTLRNRFQAARPHFDVIFIDECHRSLSPSYVQLRAWYPDAIFIGLTATPYRANGKGLGTFYDTIVVAAYPSQLVADGWIVEPTCWTVPPEDLPDLSRVASRAGEYDDDELAEACNKKQLVGSIVKHWKERAGGRLTVCFAVNVAHSMAIRDDFVDAGVRAEHLDGTMNRETRDAILARLSRGDTQVVVNCGVLCEGWDQPSVKCGILARPSLSTGLVLQQAGRILRPWNDVTAILLDHAGNLLVHGLPTEDRTFTLDDVKKKKRDDDEKPPSTKSCPRCFAVVESKVSTCPAVVNEGPPEVVCGFVWPVRTMGGPDQVEGELVRVTKTEQAEKRAYWDELCSIQKDSGRKPGWCAYEFKARYGHWPPKSFPRPGLGRPMTPNEVANFKANLERVGARNGMKNPGAWAERMGNEKAAKAAGVSDICEPEKEKRERWAV